MGRLLLGCLAAVLAASSWAQTDSRTVMGPRNPLLAEGAAAIRAGLFDEGIRLTTLGLEHEPSKSPDRAGALANLCAAYAGKGDADTAIAHCDASIELNPRNWRAYSNRSYAYYLKGMYPQARYDLDSAEALAPDARQVLAIKGMINEEVLRPRVIMEDHQ